MVVIDFSRYIFVTLNSNKSHSFDDVSVVPNYKNTVYLSKHA